MACVSSTQDTPTPDDECSLCQHAYRDPRLLPCGHNFCVRCLAEYTYNTDSEHVLKCPTCSQPFTAPAEGAWALRRATATACHVHDTIISQVMSATIPCDELECKRLKKKALAFCSVPQCGLLCEDCVGNHQNEKLMKHHNLNYLAELQKRGWVEKILPPYCKEEGHDSFEVEEFCTERSHRKLVCKKCVRDKTLHKDCDCCDPAEEAARVKESMESLLSNIDKRNSAFLTFKNESDITCSNIAQELSNVESGIQDATVAMLSEAERLRAKVFTELNSLESAIIEYGKFVDGITRSSELTEEAETLCDQLKQTLSSMDTIAKDTVGEHAGIMQDELSQNKMKITQSITDMKKSHTAYQGEIDDLRHWVQKVLGTVEDWRVTELSVKKDTQELFNALQATEVPILKLSTGLQSKDDNEVQIQHNCIGNLKVTLLEEPKQFMESMSETSTNIILTQPMRCEIYFDRTRAL